MKQWIKWISYSFISIIMVLIGFFIWAFYTSSGMNTVLHIAKPIMAKQHITIKLQQLSGAIGNLSAKTLDIALPGINIHVEKFHLSWSPWLLINNTIHIEQLNAQLISIKTLPIQQQSLPVSSSHETNNRPPYIPTISINTVDLPEITLNLNGNELIGKILYQHTQHIWHFALHSAYRLCHKYHESDRLLVKFNSQGDRNRNKTQLQLHGSSFGLDYSIHGQYHQQIWQESLSTLNLITPYGTWRLTKPTMWSFLPNNITIAKTCVHNRSSNLCLSGHYSANNARLHVYSNNINFNDWQSTNQFSHLNGNGIIDNEIRYQNGKLSGNSTLHINNLNVIPNNDSSVFQKTNYLHIQQLRWRLKLNQHKSQGQLVILFDPHNRIHANITLSKL